MSKGLAVAYNNFNKQILTNNNLEVINSNFN